MPTLARVAGIAGATFCAAATALGQPTIRSIGSLGGDSEVRALSADGQVAVGWSAMAPGGHTNAVRWTAAGGLQDLGRPPESSDSYAWAVTADGLRAFGYSSNASGPPYGHGLSWTGGGMQGLPMVPGSGADEAFACTPDGSVVVGRSSPAAGGGAHVVRWVSGVAQDLGAAPGTSPTALGVGAGGSVIAGFMEGGTSGLQAFRWTSGGGFQQLPHLPTGNGGEAFSVSADGQVIVGWAGVADGSHAVRWVGTQIQDLGVIPGSAPASAYAWATNPDGSMIVGQNDSTLGGQHAFLWTPLLGMIDLNSYLQTQGADLTGWILTRASTISADGTTIAGFGFLNGEARGWVATIPG